MLVLTRNIIGLFTLHSYFLGFVIRTVYLPKTTAKLLQKWLQWQEELKHTPGKVYQDFGLVVTLDNGRPIESRIIGSELKKLIKDNALPEVDFHSLRHTSTSVKLVLSNGDIKSVQGNTGHSQAKMVTDIYAEIDNRHRQENARKFDRQFFSGEPHITPSDTTTDQLLLSMLKTPGIRKKVLAAITSAIG